MFENEKIFILGMARSGYQAAKFLCKRNCDITVYDQKDESKLNIEQVKELRSLGVHLFLGEDETSCLDASFSYFIKSPGVFPSNSFVMKAMELKIPVINEVEMAFLLLPKDVNIVAITGTNGKTTTTSLIYDIVKRAYSSRTHLAGNIGYPLISIIDTIKENDILIMEISCQQLASLDKFHPHIAVMTNLSPAHIDMFGSYEIYKDVKAKLFKEQTSDDIA
ncbi:MAG: Mur ligase family protein, partial [Bacilli bacterium]